jgi:hypothetical protein
VWETLHPAHQAVVTRDRFDACNRDDDDGIGGTRIGVEVVETYPEPVAIKGTGKQSESTAVTLRFSYSNPLTGKPAEEHRTVHAVAVGGEWTWILAPSTYDAYVKGECPTD